MLAQNLLEQRYDGYHSYIYPFTPILSRLQLYTYVSTGVLLAENVVWAGRRTGYALSSESHCLSIVISGIRACVVCSCLLRKWIAGAAVAGLHMVIFGIKIYVCVPLIKFNGIPLIPAYAPGTSRPRGLFYSLH